MITKEWLIFFSHLRRSKTFRCEKSARNILFLALGSFGTLDPKLSHGTSSKFADVRTHLRKVSRNTIFLIWDFQIRKSFFVVNKRNICFLEERSSTRLVVPPIFRYFFTIYHQLVIDLTVKLFDDTMVSNQY